MRICDAGAPLGEITVRFRRYKPTRTLPKCVNGKSNTRVFTVNHTVDILFPDGTTPDSDVWIIVRKDEENNSAKIWRRKLGLVRDYCDTDSVEVRYETLPVTKKCEMRRDPRIRVADGYLQCLCVLFGNPLQDGGRPTPIWIERGIFPDTISDEPVKERSSSLSPEPQQCGISPSGYESSPRAAEQASFMQNSAGYSAEFGTSLLPPPPPPPPSAGFPVDDGVFCDPAFVAIAPPIQVGFPPELIGPAGLYYPLPESIDDYLSGMLQCPSYGYDFPFWAQQ